MKPPGGPGWISAARDAVVAIGGARRLARAVGVTPSRVYHWTSGISRVPAERVLAIETATGVSRHRLRPDLYAPPAEGHSHHTTGEAA